MGPELGLSPIDLGLEDKETAEKEKPIDASVVFGFGITSDQDLEKAAMGKSLIGHPELGWRLPLGAKLRTMAAAKLFSEGQVGDTKQSSEGTRRAGQNGPEGWNEVVGDLIDFQSQ